MYAGWPDPAAFVRHGETGEARLELSVQNAHCANCIAKIEAGVRALNGVTGVRLNLSTGKLLVSWHEGVLDPRAILKRLSDLGYPARPYDPAALANDTDESRFLLGCIAIAGFGSAFVMGLADILYYHSGDLMAGERQALNWVMAMVAAPAALLASRPFFRSAIRSVAARAMNMDVPISLAILLSLGLSFYQTALRGPHTYYDAAVMLPFLLLIGRYLDYRLRRKAQGAARDLVLMQAVSVRRIDPSGQLRTVTARDIAVGDRLMLASGERSPVDGVIEDTDTEADLSLVTGESAPVTITRGEALHSGSIVLGRPVVLRATARSEDSLVAELARLLEAGQQRKDRYVRIADRAARIYVPVVSGLALLVFAGWIFISPFSVALTNAITVLVVTCPCALGLAVPAVQIVATGRLFQRGLLIKSGDALERLAVVDTVVFDKTGTLTFGGARLMDPEAIDPAILEAAARLARASRHPLACALARAADPGPVAANAKEISGAGIEAAENGHVARLGRAEFVGTTSDGHTSELWFRDGESPPVRFRFADVLRPDARATIDALRARGLSVCMLSGDRALPTSRIAEAANIFDWRSGVDPKAKIDAIDQLRANGRRVLMVGDGFNDAAALARADVSIAPGTAVDATQAAADAALRGDALVPLVDAIDVARRARVLVFENLALSAVYNIVAVPLAATGLITPLMAALAMAGSSLLVTANALRLTMVRRRR